ncbi:hypothetical protein PanWU01x14_139790, partial [Parasponia andersonii]
SVFIFKEGKKKTIMGNCMLLLRITNLLLLFYFCISLVIFLPSKKQLYFFYNFMNLFVGNLSDRSQKVAGELSHFTLFLFGNSSFKKKKKNKDALVMLTCAAAVFGRVEN